MIIQCSFKKQKPAVTLRYFYMRGFSRFGVSLLLLSSSIMSRAQETTQPVVETSAGNTSIGDAVQTAENAKQIAQEQLKRLGSSSPSISNSKPTASIPASIPTTTTLPDNNNSITQAPSDAKVAADNRADEQAANAELQLAKQETQISGEHADAEKKNNLEDIKPSAKNTSTASSKDKVETVEDQAAVKKPNFFKRVWYRFRPQKYEPIIALPTISVQVVGAPELLSKNIEGKLETYTVEAFEDFRASLAQLRSMSKEASEAVGYYSAEFRFEQVNSKTLRVYVTPHDPVVVKTLQISYDGAANKDNTFISIQDSPDIKIGDQMNDQKYETTKTRIVTAGADKGYFDSYWKMHDVKVTLPDNTADIKLDYNSGERYKLGKVVFKNTNPDKPLPVDMELLEQLVPFKEGDDYGSWKVNNLSRNLSDTRYFNSVQVDTVIPDPIIKPLELPDDVIAAQKKQKELLDSENDEVSSSNIAKPVVDESQFAGTQANPENKLELDARIKQELSEAELRAQEKKKQGEEVRQTQTIPVVVSVNADKPNSAEAGIGYGTDTGVRFRTQYRKALINSHGHNLDSNLEVSQIRQALDLRYNLPYKHPLEDTLSIFGGFEREENGSIGDSFGLSTQSITVGAERAIKPKNGDWQHTMSVRYRLDQLNRETGVNVNQEDLPPPFNIDNSRFEQQSLLFGYGISKTYTKGRIDPTRAFRQFYQIDVGTKSLLTDTDLAILRAGWRFIYSFGENDNHQMVGRADAGTILTKSFEDVPYNLRFFAGGDQSIRGYDYKSLSTKQNGYLIGGQNLGVGSLEYNYQFIPKWRGAVFVDAGNAFDKNFNDPIKIGAGFGVRWSSPVGPIRVDIAAGVSESNLPIRLHFFIGPQL